MVQKFDLTTQEYIEIIFDLQKKDNFARVTDIAKERGVSRSSVSTALNVLKKRRLINHETYGNVELTPEGFSLGSELEKRHQVIARFFTNFLAIPAEHANVDACQLEHHISNESIRRLVQFIHFFENADTCKPETLITLRAYLEAEKDVK